MKIRRKYKYMAVFLLKKKLLSYNDNINKHSIDKINVTT